MDLETCSSSHVQCEVCGRTALSFHYGANTCDACKIFFRRNLGKDVKHTCARESKPCSVYDLHLKCCMCRLQRCLFVGMSVDGTKKGRYTYAKKYKCIQKTKQRKSRPLTVMETFPSTTQHEVEDVARNIARLFESCGTYDPRFFEELPQIENAYLEKKKLEAEVFGRMQPLALTEYRRIFRCSGLDIDNRQQALTKRYQSYTRRLETYISFANKISTFRKLPPADQASLFKGARVALVTISESKAFNSEKGIYTFPEKFVYMMSEMCLQGRADYVETWFLLANKIEKMKLSPQETNILKCIALFSSDNCVTEEGRVACEKEQQFMVKALEYLLTRRRGNPEDASMAMARCLLILTDFRTLHHKDYLDYEFVSKEYPRVHFPKLLLEFYQR